MRSNFDTVCQSKLIEVLSRTIKDGRVISLIHKYLNAGVIANGMYERTEIGMPQGGPLSPLLSNIMLNELDKELERRGHRYVRYADDCAPRRRGLVAWSQTSIAMLCEWWWQAHRNRHIGGGFKPLWGAVVKSYGAERQRKGCIKQSGVNSGDERSCEPLTKTSKAYRFHQNQGVSR